MNIQQKIVIVTGASQGIGLATAELLAKQGAKLVLAARSIDKLKTLAEKFPDSLAIQTDMRIPEQIKRLIDQTIEKYGHIDILINNAGQGLYAKIEDINLAEYRDVMELNVFAVLASMQAVIPQMRKQGGGMIINVSSGLSRMTIPGLAAYASTKYALNALTFTARQELEKDHIIVSAVLPRMTATDFGKNSLGTRPDWGTRPGSPPQIDPPERVAEKIAELIQSEAEEILL